MLKKRGQGLSINVIIIAIVGLIVLVVIIAILTGKLGNFNKGVESAASCANSCKALGRDFFNLKNELNCRKIEGDQYVHGTYSDAPAGCCCQSP